MDDIKKAYEILEAKKFWEKEDMEKACELRSKMDKYLEDHPQIKTCWNCGRPAIVLLGKYFWVCERKECAAASMEEE